jgi:uncharacterized damage-inducible protein DinB
MKRAMAMLWMLAALSVHAQPIPRVDPLDGLWQGFDGEWRHVSNQLVALAEAIPDDEYAWRPGPGVRSVSEVIMHIAISNFGLLNATGAKLPADLTSPNIEQTVTAKPAVIGWLKRSLEAVRSARANLKPSGLRRKVKVNGTDATVDGVYLRIIIHANEHMGQLVAYARMNNVVPPWSEGPRK